MQTFEDLYTRAVTIVNDDSTTNVAFMKSLINETYKLVCGLRSWYFLEKTITRTSTANQTQIVLPVDLLKLKTYKITIGGISYTPVEVSDSWLFNNINQGLSDDIPAFFHISNGILYTYPAIKTAGLTITIEYLRIPEDMSYDDYSDGTVSVTNGSTTVTGIGTSWGSSVVITYRSHILYRSSYGYRAGGSNPTRAGEFIQLPDGLWYEIESIDSTTSLTLSSPYQGASTTGSYIIGDTPVIPESFQDLLWYRPVGIYHFMKGSEEKAIKYFSNEKRDPGLFESLLSSMNRSNLKTEQKVQEEVPIEQSYILINNNDS